MHGKTKEQALGSGVRIAVVLAVITLVEFYLATTSLALAGVMTTAVLKTILIAQRYMHIANLWTPEAEH